MSKKRFFEQVPLDLIKKIAQIDPALPLGPAPLPQQPKLKIKKKLAASLCNCQP